MSKQLVSIELHVVIAGPIYWPDGLLCTKEASMTFTPTGGAFREPWTGLEDALERILSKNDGDFQSAGIADVWGKVTWKSGRDFIYRYMDLDPDNLAHLYPDLFADQDTRDRVYAMEVQE
jgi:hypothetical protein